MLCRDLSKLMQHYLVSLDFIAPASVRPWLRALLPPDIHGKEVLWVESKARKSASLEAHLLNLLTQIDVPALLQAIDKRKKTIKVVLRIGVMHDSFVCSVQVSHDLARRFVGAALELNCYPTDFERAQYRPNKERSRQTKR